MADSGLADVDALVDAAAQAFGVTFDMDDSIASNDATEGDLPPELLIDAPAVAD